MSEWNFPRMINLFMSLNNLLRFIFFQYSIDTSFSLCLCQNSSLMYAVSCLSVLSVTFHMFYGGVFARARARSFPLAFYPFFSHSPNSIGQLCFERCALSLGPNEQ